MMLEPVVKTIRVNCNAARAFTVFTKEMGTWWPLDKNSVSAMNGAVAQSVHMEPRVGGSIIEVDHNGDDVLWGHVTHLEEGKRLTLAWHIGRPESEASEVDVRFENVGDQTLVTLTHSNWEVFGEKAQDMRNGYNAGWVGVFEKAYAAAC